MTVLLPAGVPATRDWSQADIGIRFGAPALLLVIGLALLLWGRRNLALARRSPQHDAPDPVRARLLVLGGLVLLLLGAALLAAVAIWLGLS